MEEAWFRRRGFHKPVSDARDKLLVLKQELVTVQNMRPEEFISEEEYGDTKSKYLTGRIGMDVLSKISRKTARKGHRRAIGLMLKREKIQELNALISETGRKLKKLEREQENEKQYAEELSRRYRACSEKSKKPG